MFYRDLPVPVGPDQHAEEPTGLKQHFAFCGRFSLHFPNAFEFSS